MALSAWLLLGEPLGVAGAAGIALSAAGALLVARPPFLFGQHAGWGPARLAGLLASVSSSLCAAGVAFSIRRIGSSEAALTIALAFHSCTLALSAPPLALSWPQRPVAPSPHEALLLVLIAFTSFLAQLLLTRSFQLLPASRASAIGFTSVVYGHILGMALFGERLTWPSALGSAVILAGVLMTTASGAGPHSGKDGRRPQQDGQGQAGEGGQVLLVPKTQQQQQQQEGVVGGAPPQEWLLASRHDPREEGQPEGDEEAPLLTAGRQLALEEQLESNQVQRVYGLPGAHGGQR